MKIAQMQSSGCSFRVPGGPLVTRLLMLFFLAEFAQAQVFTVLYSFGASSRADGREPRAELIRDGKGNLYGTTEGGGAFGFGAVFKLDSSGRERMLYSFTGGDGFRPQSRLVRDGKTNVIYGTTVVGGTPEGGKCRYGCGALFKLDATGREEVLYRFSGGADGHAPMGRLVRDADGNLYGTTSEGGAHRGGIVFKVSPSGAETVLYSFTGGVDGGGPDDGVIRDKVGNLYGTTEVGGQSECWCGTVFRLDSNGNLTTLHSFTRADGLRPVATVARDGAGNLYGTTNGGGDFNFGVVYKLDTAGNLTVLHSFSGLDGAYPTTAPVVDKAGNVYGVTYSGGSYGHGVIFQVDAAGNETTLYDFTGGIDGGNPNRLLLDDAGNLYGTTPWGGDGVYKAGTIFKLTP